jgi:hypothetical protein
MPRPKKAEAVIPTRSLVASAVRYTGKTARIYRQNQDWQTDCYRHYAICGEARFAARFFGHSVSRAVLGIGSKENGTTTPLTEGQGVDLLDDLFNGKEGQEQMLESLGIHLTIAGECYLVGRKVVTEEESGMETENEVWEVVSVLEMRVTGTKWQIDYGDGLAPVTLTDDDVVIRIWIQNPAKRMEADSPFRSLLPILSEIEWLTRHVFAQVSSRLAGAGILFVSQGMSFPPPPEVDGAPQQVANEADALMLTLADAMMTPIHDPGSPNALIPIVVSVPAEVLEKGDPAKLMHFWSDLDEKALTLRQEAIRRFALGMELPPEQVLGMSSNSGTGGGASNGVSHWGAWQIEESTIKMFVEPMLDTIVNALTIGYIRPLVTDVREVVIYDTANLRLRPDRSKEAVEMYDRGELSGAAMLRENGFDVTDAMNDEERKTWLVRKIASGSATPEQVGAALKWLGVDLGPTDAAPPGTPGREERPPPSLEEHPSPQAPPELSALLAASDALVWRALERAGNRIRQDKGIKPPGVPAYSMHTLVKVNGTADAVLDDAWSCAPQVLAGLADVDTTVQSLNSYCKTLFAEQAPHTRERLAQWLEVTA